MGRAPSGSKKAQPTARRGQLVVAGVILGVAVMYTGKNTLDFTIAELPAEKQVAPVLDAVAPQGWSFFTKSPRDPDVRFLTSDSGVADGDQVQVLTPHSRPVNFFGWNRSSRAQAAELALVVGELEDSQWTTCNQDTCDQMEDPVVVANPEPDPSLCGPLTFQQVEPVAWAYREFTDTAYRVVNQIEVDIDC